LIKAGVISAFLIAAKGKGKKIKIIMKKDLTLPLGKLI
jgi:hypothetical protein